MILDSITTQSTILESALQAAEYKNQVILNNIANADTPGFKGKHVEFESVLNDALETSRRTGKLDMSGVMPKLMSKHSGYSVRIDENNIDAETELTEFYKNAAKYDVITNSILNNSSRMNFVIANAK